MQKGDIVEIKNHDLNGKEIIEGKAELIKPITPHMGGWQLWEVQFVNDNTNETFYRRIPL